MKNRFRILHCLRAPVGGLFRHVCDLAAAQHALGHGVAVVCADDGNRLTAGKLAGLRAHLDLGLHRFATTRDIGLGDVGAILEVAALGRRHGFDIIHGHGAKGGAYARLATFMLARRGHPPACFYTPHGGSLHYTPASAKGRFVAVLERRLERITDGVIFESAYSARCFADQIGVATAATRIIPNGVGASEFAPVAYRSDATEFLFVGELRRLKGVDVLVEAMAEVNRTRPDKPARLTIVGDGPDSAEFRAQSMRLGMDACVQFAGALPAAEAFKLGHVLIVPSRAESFPYIVLEAGAARIPLLSTDVGGIPEIIGDSGVTLLPAGDVARLAAAMQHAIAAPAQLEIGAGALSRRIAEHFTIVAMTSAVLDFYAMARRAPASAA